MLVFFPCDVTHVACHSIGRISNVLLALFQKNGLQNPDDGLEVLALDVRTLLSDLRRTRRQWRREAKRQKLDGEWPKHAHCTDPKFFRMVTTLKISENLGGSVEDFEEPAESEALLFDVEQKPEELLAIARTHVSLFYSCPSTCFSRFACEQEAGS